MTIESLGMRRPAAAPARGKQMSQSARRDATVPSTARSFDAAEVHGGKPPMGQGTKEMLSKLHERGLLTNVSRPLGPDGQPIQSYSRGRTYGEVDTAQAEMAEIPERDRERIHEAVLKFGAQRFGHVGQSKEPAEGRVYGRPRPQPPQAPETARQDSGVFTIKLYSPKEDTGKTLRIGSHVIPLEADGSILAGMPDGTVRRITFDQDVMDEMVARGEAWMEGDEPAGAGQAGTGPMEGPLPTNARAEEKQEAEKPSNQSSSDAVRGKGNPALVAQLKADLERRQAQMLDMVREMLGKQGKAASGDGIWRTLASGNFQVDAKARAEAQKNIAEGGYWGVEQTSDRIVQFAVGLAGSSPEMLNKMEEAFEKGYAAAEKKWGGALPSITQQTRARVHEKFEELRKQQSQSRATEADGSGPVLATITVKARTIEEETA